MMRRLWKFSQTREMTADAIYAEKGEEARVENVWTRLGRLLGKKRPGYTIIDHNR